MKKLRVCHYPQIPCEPFIIEVEDLKEAYKIMNMLADYDFFQYHSNIKPDYSNMAILEQWDEEEQEWCDWCDDETGIDDLEKYFEFIKEVE